MDERIRDAMRYISRQRPRGTRRCVVCGATISDALKTRRYCSQRCQKRAYRARKRDQTPPA